MNFGCERFLYSLINIELPNFEDFNYLTPMPVVLQPQHKKPPLSFNALMALGWLGELRAVHRRLKFPRIPVKKNNCRPRPSGEPFVFIKSVRN